MPRAARAPRSKSIYDPVHGPMRLAGASLDLIGHPAFQRLWGIRQTGCAHLVFPGANHTRLEHSLGVRHVAGRIARRLDLSSEVTELLQVGGLLHDLGHAPFSHTLDGTMEESIGLHHEAISRALVLGQDLPELPGFGTAAEPGTVRSLPEIIERHGVSPQRVASLITGEKVRGVDRRLVPLLHGPVDADRIDYLQRDAHYTGVAHGVIDAERLLDTMEWSPRGSVFAAKGRSALEGFLMGRTLMYSSVYYHKTVRAAEVMIASAVERDPGFPESARPLFGLTDGEFLAVLRRRGGLAQTTVERLETRALFKLAGGWREIPAGARPGIRRLQSDPVARRRVEAVLAGNVGAPDGSVLLDVVAGGPRAPEARDLDAIGIREGARITHPFRGDGPWRSILLRPSTPWSVALYFDSARRPAAAGRLLGRLPGALDAALDE